MVGSLSPVGCEWKACCGELWGWGPAIPSKAEPAPELRPSKFILGNAGFFRGEEPGMMLGVWMDRVGVGERDGEPFEGGESRLDPLDCSLDALGRMLRGATSGKGWGELGRWIERGPIGLAGLGWSDCIVSFGEEDDGRGLKLATALGHAGV